MACYALCLNTSHSTLAPTVFYGCFMIFTKERTIMLLTGGGWLEHFNMKTFFLSGSCCKQFCVCLRLPANSFSFYLHTIYFSVYSLCKQFKSKFSNPPPPPQKNNGLSLTEVLLLDLVEVPFCVFFCCCCCFFFHILKSYRQSLCHLY